MTSSIDGMMGTLRNFKNKFGKLHLHLIITLDYTNKNNTSNWVFRILFHLQMYFLVIMRDSRFQLTIHLVWKWRWLAQTRFPWLVFTNCTVLYFIMDHKLWYIFKKSPQIFQHQFDFFRRVNGLAVEGQNSKRPKNRYFIFFSQ